MNLKRKTLNVDIRKKKVKVSDKSEFWYCMWIDGDKFWSRTYQGSINTLLEIITRDELKK